MTTRAVARSYTRPWPRASRPSRIGSVCCLTLLAALAGCGPRRVETPTASVGSTPRPAAALDTIGAPSETDAARALSADLDEVFSAPALSRALVGVQIVSLTSNRVVYQRHHTDRVIPGSALKLVTVATAAERLGWTHRFVTTLDAVGVVENGVLTGDLVITGGGDPSIGAQDLKGSALFDEWADALISAGIRRVEGRLIGDDNALMDEPLGAGWAWDYLTAGYAAPSGALSYNENVLVLRITPASQSGAAATVDIGPPGHNLTLAQAVTTSPPGSPATVSIARPLGQRTLTVTGSVAAGAAPLVRTTTIENPTQFFIGALNTQLASRGIVVAGGAADIDDVASIASGPRRTIARRESEPLSAIAGYTLKVSQNYYGEMLIKAAGRGSGVEPGSTERGRRAVREVLQSWQISTEPLVMHDGSGLSRYNYASAELIADVLAHTWRDERLRGPFAAALPVAGRDGTLGARMRTPALQGRVQAKTGTLDNVRSLAGYLHTDRDTYAFAMIANHFTAPVAEVDAVMERALERLVR